MSFGDILNQFMEQGLGPKAQPHDRAAHAAQAVAGGGTGAADPASGGVMDRARDFLGSEQAAGLTGAQIGGLGAAAGFVTDGFEGAIRGGALALLGTLAMGALSRRRAAAAGEGVGGGSVGPAPGGPGVDPRAIGDLGGVEGEKLALRAMISAAKADGSIDPGEMQAILGRLDSSGATAAERQFVLDEMARPLDLPSLVAQVRNPAQAAQVYAASLLCIGAESETEKAYLRELAQALQLDPDAVVQLHRMAGTPL